MLKDKEVGSFVIRESSTYVGSFGLAVKVSSGPDSPERKMGDSPAVSVRHFLIEFSRKGVCLKGGAQEPYFGSLSAFVYQHCITPISLPNKLRLPRTDCLRNTAEGSGSAVSPPEEPASRSLCFVPEVRHHGVSVGPPGCPESGLLRAGAGAPARGHHRPVQSVGTGHHPHGQQAEAVLQTPLSSQLHQTLRPGPSAAAVAEGQRAVKDLRVRGPKAGQRVGERVSRVCGVGAREHGPAHHQSGERDPPEAPRRRRGRRAAPAPSEPRRRALTETPLRTQLPLPRRWNFPVYNILSESRADFGLRCIFFERRKPSCLECRCSFRGGGGEIKSAGMLPVGLAQGGDDSIPTPNFTCSASRTDLVPRKRCV
ncbi:uncharacterized protein [Hemitrygon akajei]|uniref:uncharacterized protein n=1 Tax=Hemitrygon akajei TaxID=2704970 RepID=UPI003BF9F587